MDLLNAVVEVEAQILHRVHGRHAMVFLNEGSRERIDADQDIRVNKKLW
jgi:hypothetical protein